MLGANPFVSHGVGAHGAAGQATSCTRSSARGGRVVVVDPRRTETARALRARRRAPGQRRLAAALAAARALRRGPRRRGGARTRRPPAPARCARPPRQHPPEATEARTGVAAPTTCGRSPATLPRRRAPRSTAAPARAWAASARSSPSCIDALNAVTGNLDRPGGAVFGRPAVALDEVAEQTGLDTYGEPRARASAASPT